MRLSHFFVVVAAAFLATGALADTNVALVNEPSHRNLRKHHHTIEDEERGIKDIPLERLHSLGRRVGVNADDVLNDAAAAMSAMTKTQQKNWMAGLSKLLKAYKKAKAPRITYD
ncbi:hypothetical protein DVH05_002433 [Phytophthora capsici]|nr:hypothetical protein DVH05_002433 [Phytophthora capsici]|eukprot:jgi/Phyca11/19338/fgenesh1_pg.PHYCAscaffold_47_\